MFRCRKSLAVLMTLCFLFTLAVPSFASETGSTGVSLEEARDGIVGYYLENKTELESWKEVVALREAGQDLSKAPWKLPDWKVESLSKDSWPTDYAGAILGMLAAGQDPKQVAVGDKVYSLVDNLADLQRADGSFNDWLNQTIWSIIALDKAEGNYNVENARKYLLSQQKSDGGFTLFGDTAEPDTTGNALLALAPYKEIEGVADAVNSAIECLKEMQLASGGFASWGTENTESIAAVIRGLLACGEKDITSGDWQKEKGNMIDALFAFQLEDGSFAHEKDGDSDDMATVQALMAVTDMVYHGITYTVTTGKGPSSGGTGGSVTGGQSVGIAVVGSDGNLLFGPSTVEIHEGATYGYTPLGALDATHLNYTLSGYVTSISGQANSGMSGWMFAVNDRPPMEAADKCTLRDGDRVVWYYSKNINDPLPKWDDLKEGITSPTGSTTPAQSLDTVKEKLKDFENGKLSVSELITVIGDEVGKLKDAELTEEQKEQFARAAQQVAQSLEDTTDKAIRVLPGGGEIRVKIDGKKIEDFADCLDKARELSTKLKELGIEDVGSLVKDSLVVELPADKTLDQAVTTVLPVEAGQALIEKKIPLVIAGPEVSCSIPPEAVETVLGAVDEAADIEISAHKVSSGKVNIEGAALVGGKALELDISAVTAAGEKEKPESGFEKPVTFTISLAGVDTEKLNAKRLAVYRKGKAGSWEYVGGKLASDGQSFSFKTQSTSLYALMEFQKRFPDIEGHWGQDEIELMAMRLVARGMGDGSFAPDQKITRAQFAALLVNALELPCKSTPEQQSFKDVSVSYWGYSPIETAFDAGLISGVGDGRFAPERGITREEIASLTARALKKCGADLELSGKAVELLEKFKDSGEVSTWARDDLAVVVSKEIITGRSGAMIAPKTGATRAEAVVVLKKLLQNLGRI